MKKIILFSIFNLLACFTLLQAQILPANEPDNFIDIFQSTENTSVAISPHEGNTN